ncbi:helix-turn-helix transcriptional regulator [bacterium]|nr:helix-turn-helix transcriptional regulator [bacterium]
MLSAAVTIRSGNRMIKNGQARSAMPVVPWQGDPGKTYRLFQLGNGPVGKPADGHDPTVPHRIGFHAFMLIKSGRFDHWIDFATHRLTRNQLLYIGPSQIHHFIRNKRPHSAWLLIFRPEIFPGDLPKIANAGSLPWSVASYLWPSLTTLKPRETQLLDEQFDLLEKLDSEPANSYAAAAIYQACGIITLAFANAMTKSGEVVTKQANRRFLDFVQLVEESFAEQRDVRWYAGKLSCSERTLRRTCQDSVGKSAKAFLTQRVVTEAKRLLAYRTDSVTTIGELLGFHEPTNFVRFFRDAAGMTPQAFRTTTK